MARVRLAVTNRERSPDQRILAASSGAHCAILIARLPTLRRVPTVQNFNFALGDAKVRGDLNKQKRQQFSAFVLPCINLCR